MCGISALFANEATFSLATDIQQMNRLVHHRGPDDEGYVLFGPHAMCILGGSDTPKDVYQSAYAYAPKEPLSGKDSLPSYAALAQRRLSIVDLSAAGHQPMCTPNQKLWITYNGEVYNYREIRLELERLGCQFHTQSDTEVILQAYEIWGEAAFTRFNGMFAFILYDAHKKTGIAVRDRFGVKPLYYWIAPQGTLAFGSEIKQFTGVHGWQAKVNGQRAYDFLQWGILDHTAETCFAGVQQLRGGQCMRFSLQADTIAKSLEIKEWYRLPHHHFRGSFSDAQHTFSDLLHDSIKLRLHAEVDVGSCLSGGLDSSAIVCIASNLRQAQNATTKQKTFSAYSDVKRFDERHFIEKVISRTQVDAHHVTPKAHELFDDYKQVLWHQDEPFGSTSIYAQWLVFKLAKAQGIKVMLDGQGADEYLAGYHGFFGNRFYDLFSNWRWKTLYDEMVTSKRQHGALNPATLLLSKLVPKSLVNPLRLLTGKQAKANWLNLDILQAQVHPPLVGPYKTVTQQSRQQLLQSSLPMLLHWEDRDSMAHSIESRTPFLDYRLVEFSLSLPSDFKIAQGKTKQVLRESMRNILPEEIRTRTDKLGFATAEEEWLKKQMPERFRQELDQAIAVSKGVLHPSCKDFLNEMIAGKRPFNFLPWRLIVFGYWMERYHVGI